MRKSFKFQQVLLPEMHRYAKSTFHEGAHRQSPGDSTPWRDTSSPINRLRAWWLAPMAKGSVIAAWCITIAMGTFCFSIQEDAKGTYLLNNVLLRNLNDEIQRADANQQRVSELEETLRQQIEKKECNKNLPQLNQSIASSNELNKGSVNYELQLSREKYRGDRIHERNQCLVEEIAKLRQELSKSNDENRSLLQEISRLNRFTKRVQKFRGMSDFRGEIQQLARAYQYRLHPFALKRLSEFLKGLDCDGETSRSLLRDLFALLKKKCIEDRFIDQAKIDSVISIQMNLIKGTVDKSNTSPQVVLLENVPRIIIDESTGQIKTIQGTTEGNRLSVMKQRYLMAYHRCLRSGIYRSDLKQRLVGEELLPLVPITALEGMASDLQIAVLGLIRKREPDIFLEDLNGQIKLNRFDCSNLNMHNFICSGFFVVATGFYNHGLLVTGISLPPSEKRGLTRALLPTALDCFGLAPTNLEGAIAAERTSHRSVILFLAHVFLDRPTTMTQLAYFFEKMQGRGEQDLLETTFVLIGNFTSTPLSYGDVSHLFNAVNGEETFHCLLENLGTCIASCAPTAAQHSQFVFIPGPTDLTALQGFLPQHPLTKNVTKGLRSKLKKVILAPNPCRIRFFTREIVVSRRDYLRAFHDGERCFDWDQHRQNESDSVEPQATSFERVCKTIIDEGHLAPDLEESVLWKLDDSLRLPILPHTLILCDSTLQWECYYKDVHVVNPGSFSVNTTFLWCTPSDGECTLSDLK